MAIVIGITGLIASGKSTLTSYLIDKKFKVFDADLEVKKLYSNKLFLKKLQSLFPLAFKDNILNKNLLAKSIFNNILEKKKLENLIHPLIEKKCDKFIKKYQNEKLIFLDVPLLFEAGWDVKCSKVILITINKIVQKQRYISRGGNEEDFKKILKNQLSIKYKRGKSDYILPNNKTKSTFYKKIDNIILKLMSF